MDPEWDVTDDFRELAIELKGSAPDEVFRQIGNARIVPETLSLNKVLEEYYTFKCEDAAQDLPLKGRIARIRKDLVIVLGKNRVGFTELKDWTCRGLMPLL